MPPRIHAALLAVAHRLDGAGVRWLVAGSAGRALLGHRVRPADLDVEVADEDAARAGAALGTELVPASGAGRSSLRGSTRIAGVEVDVTAALVVEAAGRRLAGSFPSQLGEGIFSRLGDRRIPVAPPEEALVRALVLGEWGGVAKVARGAGPSAEPPRPGYVARRLASAISTAIR